jgi:hypothetical protein
MTTDVVAALGERIDQLVSLDAPARGVISELYRWARAKSDGPLCLTAARLLRSRVAPGQPVFIATGWPDRPHISARIAETDGPPGAAALARAVHRGLGAVPIVLIEEELVPGMSRVVEAAGLRVLAPAEAIAAARSQAPIHAASVLASPKGKDEAAASARALVAEYAPAAVVAIEKGGMNEHGFIHTSRGDDTTDALAKADYLVREATARGIATIGIGDGGNEIGMGVIEEEIRAHVPFGASAKDPAKGGTAPHTRTDVLVAAAISNWGAYGVAACLAFLLGRPDVFHDAEVEARILRVAADASFIDGITGFVEPSADGLPLRAHEAFVTLVGETVRQALARGK